MTNYGPFAPAGWTSADQVCCSASSFDAVGVDTEGGYIDDTDTSTYSVALRFSVDTTGMTSFTSASLVLQRTPNSYGEGGTNGTIGIRIEDSTSSAEYSSGANPWGRTYRATQVDYNFPSDGSTVTIDVSAIFSDFFGAHSPGAHTITLMFGAQARGWQASSVSYRCVTNQQNTGGVLPSLTIVGSSGGSTVTVTADAGGATGAGSAAGVTSAQKAVATAGAATGAGSAATISTTSITTVTADPGAATGSGSQATPKSAQLVTATAGAASGVGSTATLRTNVVVVASPGSATGSGQTATTKSSQTVTATAGVATGAGPDASIQSGSFVPGTRYPTLSDYFTHTIPGRPRTIIFWAWDNNDDYNYLWMSGADYFYRDIVFDEGDPRFGEPGWLIFEKNQGAQRIYIERRYWGRWCAAIVYRANGDTDVYYGHEGGEMNLVGTTTGSTGDSTEWWFGMFEGVIGWSGGTEYLYIDNTEWDLTRIRSQFRHRNPTASMWGFYPLENGSGAAETYGTDMTTHGSPVADSQGVEFPIFVTVNAEAGSATGSGSSVGTVAAQTVTAATGSATGTGSAATLYAAQTVSASPGTATGTGSTAGTLSLQIVTAVAGAASGVGSSATISSFAQTSVVAGPGAATGVGSDAGAMNSITLSAAPGAASGEGSSAGVGNVSNATVIAEPGSAEVTWATVDARTVSIVSALSGTATGYGYSATIIDSGAPVVSRWSVAIDVRRWTTISLGKPR